MSILKASLAFREINHKVAALQLGLTLLCYGGALAAAIMLSSNLLFAIPLIVIAGLAALRLYMVQHDCMHRSFVRSKWLNDAIGILLSPITLSPYKVGRFNHGQHHSHVADLDQRDSFEINVLTVEEFRNLGGWGRGAYRLYRSPFTLLVIGPMIMFCIIHRFPKNTFKSGSLWDVVLHNLLLAAFVGSIFAVSGWNGVLVLLGSIYVGVSFGAFIPYVEHNFEDVNWGRKPELDFETAALQGSAVLDFGDLFHFITANIGYHDLHHLNPMVPSYRLKECYEALEKQGLLKSRKIKWGEAFSSLKWKLWDEEQQRMVTFAAA